MKNKKIIIIIGSVLVVSLIAAVLVFLLTNKNKVEVEKLYITKNDIEINEIEVCYDSLGYNVDCNSTDFAYGFTEYEIAAKKNIQKVLVNLNGKDKAVFIVLKGNIDAKEDLLLIYDGLYVKSSDEAYYTYERGIEVLNNLKWKNAKVIRLLTEEEAKLLSCDENTTCDWLVQEPDNETEIDNWLGGHYGYGFTVTHEKASEFDNRVYFVNSQGYLVIGGSLGGEKDKSTYGLRPVIQISSKYVKLYSTIKTVIMKNENQKVETKFVNDKMANIKITNTYSNLSNERFEELKNKLDNMEDTDNITFGSSSIRYGDTGDNKIWEYIYINCEGITFTELNGYIKISSMDLNYEQFINEMKNNGYLEI